MNNLKLLMSILLGILCIASLVGFILNKKTPINSPKKEMMINLNQRINSWWFMIFILMFSFFSGSGITLILFGLLSYIGLKEFISIVDYKQADIKTLAVSFFLLIPLQYYLIYLGWYGLFSILIPVYCFLFLPLLSTLSGDTDKFLQRVANIQFGIMLTIYCISHVPALLLLNIPNFEQSNNIVLLFFVLFVSQSSDVLQYIFGKLFGKHKIAPKVSPSKTVEGFIGGGLSATLLGSSLYWITPFTYLQTLGFAFIIVVMGFTGGLVLSAIKRSVGAKDWGQLVKGHGGVMDRLDSVAFSAPIFFHLVRYFFTN